MNSNNELDELGGFEADLEPVRIYTPIKDQYGTVYESTAEAARRLGLRRVYIERNLGGWLQHVRGYRFTFGG